MPYVMRGMATLVLGVGLMLVGTAGAQQIVPVTPIAQPSLPTVPTVPTPVTPSTPLVPAVTPPFCDVMTDVVIPSGSAVKYTTCLLPVDATTGLLCLTGVAAGGGLTSSCSNVFITMPGAPTPVQLPVPTPLPTPAK